MASTVKTVVATGASSGIGFEAIKQLLAQSQPYRFILGVRDTARTQAAFDGLQFDASRHTLTLLPLELSNLKTVRSFAKQTLDTLGATGRIDYLFLNAATIKSAVGPGPYGSKWSEIYIVNHLSQHYLTHLLRAKLEASHSRVVFVSSGAIRLVSDPTKLEADLLSGSTADEVALYSESKFVQLLNAHWWRRQLDDHCTVVAVSPGLIPQTNLARSTTTFRPTMDMPDAKTVPIGAASVLRAFTEKTPSDPDQIFLTSWGEWWSKDVFEKTLDNKLQNKWSPSKEDIEKTENTE